MDIPTFLKIRSTGLGRKLLFLIILASSIITLFLTITQLYLDYRVDRGLLDERFAEVEQSHIPSLISNIWLLNKDIVISQLEGVNSLPDFVHTELLDDKGNLFHHVGEKAGKYLIKKEWPLVYDSPQGERQIGVLVVWATLDNIYSRLLDKVFVILASQAVKTFLVSGVILFIIFTVVTYRLGIVSNFLAKWDPTSDELPPKIDTKKRKKTDELDDLVTIIEAMRTRLSHSFEKMQKLFDDVQKQKNQLKSVFDGSSDIILVLNIKKQIVSACNRRAWQALGYQEKDLIEQPIEKLFPSSFKEIPIFNNEGKTDDEIIEAKELRLSAKGGHFIPVEIVSSVIEYHDQPHLLVLGRDISERKIQEAKINRMAWYDSLTGLPNRALIRDRIHQALLHNKRHADYSGVLFVDLDYFKDINDSLGHNIGDQLLIEVSQRLKDVVREEDSVGRLGGDEFIILLNNLGLAESVARKSLAVVANKLCNSLADPFYIENNKLSVTASMGGALSPIDGEDVDELLRRADLSMYKSKEAGRNHFTMYTNDLDAISSKRLNLFVALREATHNQEFVLFYQPIIDMQTNQVVSVEALIRWNKGGVMVSPSGFITQLSETGLIIPVGGWAIETACREMMTQLKAGNNQRQISIAVNVSPVQFGSEGFLEHLKKVLTITGLPPHLLVLEVTEDLTIDDSTSAIEMLHKIRELGVKLALDDFGTGYSSLSYLKRLPASKLKIDQSFTRDMLIDPDDKAIVSTIISIAKELKLEVVAEGVEQLEHAETLIHMGCEQAQGFYFMKPQASLRKAMLMELPVQLKKVQNN
nr:EAL domain-containing protein [Spartinivicinus marinus]